MKARLTPEADLDAQSAIRWYDERSRELGDDFLRKVNECIISVEKTPEKYPVVHREMRRALVARFPYAVIYEIENTEIIIYAIYHCARNPEIWKRRRDA
ncbi:MAG TPA: type II toxin-antitoxin system RelE/ParE family toxin [Terriglobia bacterium]|nr:type II toxin-antitoxin system RelE/ParE family toxin [Terriglobia bacterium]